MNDKSMPASAVRMSRISKRIIERANDTILTPNQQFKQLTMAQQLEEARTRLKPAGKSTNLDVV